jgi:1,2-diacylglycerol 3-beta-galactosyltransferase
LQTEPTLAFVYFEAGGGHRSAALALQGVIRSGNYGWNIQLVNLQEVLDSLDIFRKLTGVRMEDIYNKMLAKGWTLGSGLLLPMMHGIIRIYHKSQVKLLMRFWEEQRPDLVVSLIPNFDRALFESMQIALPGRPFVTVLTDLADFPPHFWMERQPQQYFICGTTRAIEQARALDHPAARTFLTSGMILRPTFYEEQPKDRAFERQRLALDPNLPTGLVLFGGEGSSVMYSIARQLGNSSLDLQLILICGRNEKLKRRLKALKTRNKLFVEGFTKQVPYFMHLSDFFIGKPGPGSISEALHMHLPVIIEKNAWTLPQERFNADWVKENGFGIVLENFRGIKQAVRTLLDPKTREITMARIAALNNRAVFEVPQILDTILDAHQQDGTNTGKASSVSVWEGPC